MTSLICCKKSSGHFPTVICITFKTSLFAVVKVHQFLSRCNPCLMFPCEFSSWEGEKMTFHFCIHAIFYQNLRKPWRLSPFICSGTGAKSAFREVELKHVNIRKNLKGQQYLRISAHTTILSFGEQLWMHREGKSVHLSTNSSLDCACHDSFCHV